MPASLEGVRHPAGAPIPAQTIRQTHSFSNRAFIRRLPALCMQVQNALISPPSDHRNQTKQGYPSLADLRL
jgi:hypothetical protein